MVSSVYDLDVYHRAYQAALEVHKLSLEFPQIEQFALSSQLRRSSKSICANLAEGFAKSHKSANDFKRYISIAVGSAEETKVWLNFAKDLSYINEEKFSELNENYSIICKQLNSLSSNWRF